MAATTTAYDPAGSRTTSPGGPSPTSTPETETYLRTLPRGLSSDEMVRRIIRFRRLGAPRTRRRLCSSPRGPRPRRRRLPHRRVREPAFRVRASDPDHVRLADGARRREAGRARRVEPRRGHTPASRRRCSRSVVVPRPVTWATPHPLKRDPSWLQPAYEYEAVEPIVLNGLRRVRCRRPVPADHVERFGLLDSARFRDVREGSQEPTVLGTPRTTSSRTGVNLAAAAAGVVVLDQRAIDAPASSGGGELLTEASARSSQGAKRRCTVSPPGPSTPRPASRTSPVPSGRASRPGVIPAGSQFVGIVSVLTTGHARYVEFGTSPHVIRAEAGVGPRQLGRATFGPAVHHPARRRNAFLRPALDDLRRPHLPEPTRTQLPSVRRREAVLRVAQLSTALVGAGNLLPLVATSEAVPRTWGVRPPERLGGFDDW